MVDKWVDWSGVTTTPYYAGILLEDDGCITPIIQGIDKYIACCNEDDANNCSYINIYLSKTKRVIVTSILAGLLFTGVPYYNK